MTAEKKALVWDDLRKTDWCSLLPVSRPADHKYLRGHCLVISGPIEKAGAACLSASVALRVGAGLVTVATPEDALGVHNLYNPSLMIAKYRSSKDIAALIAEHTFQSVVVGPGLGPDKTTREIVSFVIHSGCSAALDAGAISAFRGYEADLIDLLRTSKMQPVLTPHEGEFSRVFGIPPKGLKDRARMLSACATSVNAHIALKGHRSLHATPQAHVAILPRGSKWLSTAGTGDILIGVIAGLICQGLVQADAIQLGWYLHAKASYRLGPYLVSSDMELAIWDVLKALCTK